MVANAVPAANMTQSLLRSVLHLLPLLLLLTVVAVGAAPLGIGRPIGVGNNNSQTDRIGRCPASSSFAISPSVSVSQSVKGVSSSSVAPCRHFFKQRYGTLSTPGFPSAFPVPFICSWIIDATAFEPDSFITLYLTQMYLTRGVQAVSYSFRNETHDIGRKELDELHTLRPRPYSVYRIKARYLEVQVNLHESFNANLRVERRLMDVYGFNITYEIQPNGSRIRPDTCNAVNCTFNGHCYVNHNYSQFQCSCLPGFTGKSCQYGPDCNPAQGINICKNGGTCGYRTGLTVVRCSCPPNFNGSLCEYRRELIPAKECLWRFRLNCSHQCNVTEQGVAVCRCPLDHALKADNLTCYPLVPLRALGLVEIERPPTLNDTQLLDAMTSMLRDRTVELTAELFTLGSIDMVAPNRFQFLLWNSAKYNMSWINSGQQLSGPVSATVRSPMLLSVKKGASSPTAAGLSKSNVGNGRFSDLANSNDKKRLPRDVPVIFAGADKQWTSSFATFAKLMNTRSWNIERDLFVAVKNFSITTVPALLIEWVRLDVKGGQVREGYPFTVACNVNGSKFVKLRWFKDGYPIEPSGALLRKVSVFVHRDQDLRGFHTLYLEIKQASVADRGKYECMASDWGQTVNKSVFLDVVTPPILDLLPASPSVFPNTALNLTCRDENHLARRTVTKYVWLKNGQPIQSSCEEIIEDLTPVGSLLKIVSIQQNANYTCRGENVSVSSQQTTRVYVVRPGRACSPEDLMGVSWPLTATDATANQFCPKGYVGVAKRRCTWVEQPIERSSTVTAATTASTAFTWKWETPDLSHCSERGVHDLNRQLKLVVLGYAVDDVASITAKFNRLVIRKLNAIEASGWANWTSKLPSPAYLPGEGNALLELSRNIEVFLWKKTDLLPQRFWNSTAIDFLFSLDALLSMPSGFYSPNNVTPVLRLMQNHATLLSAKNPGAFAMTDVKTRSLKNSFIETHPDTNIVELKYKSLDLNFLPGEGGFKSIRQLSSPLFVLTSNETNVTMDFNVPINTVVNNVDEEPHCALLQLKPTEPSHNWEFNLCIVNRLSVNASSFRCQCSHRGTAILLLTSRHITEAGDPLFAVWLVVRMATSSSLLIVMVTLIILSVRWFRQRSAWAWFQIQLGFALLPLSSAYLRSPEHAIDDPLWTILLTIATYHYMSTVLVMAVHWRVSLRRTGEPDMDMLSQHNLRLIGFSFGVPLALTGIHILLEELTTRLSNSCLSWLAKFHSVSGILFCLVYTTFLLVSVALYVSSKRKTNEFKKLNSVFQDKYLLDKRLCYERCCLFLTALNLIVTGSMLLDQQNQWTSHKSVAHYTLSTLHLVAVSLWSVLVLSYSGDGYVCNFRCCCCRNENQLPKGETVSEMLNATDMTESPQRQSLLSPNDLSVGDSLPNNNRRSSLNNSNNVSEVHMLKNKRSYRAASSPLLQRAGLGPEVQRAFGLSEQSMDKQADNKNKNENEHDPVSEVADSDLKEPITSGRQRIDSTATVPDDMDSGFGPSGGGGSQKLGGFDKFSEAWKMLLRIRWKFPQLIGPWSNNDGDRGGSFRSRRSTTSSATTTEFAGEQNESLVTNHTEVGLGSPVMTDVPYRLRRSRTRWLDDYGQENELDSSGSNDAGDTSTVTYKLKRGHCFIRCSPEKWNLRCTQVDLSIGNSKSIRPLKNSCERCWHNPETPYCDQCIASGKKERQQSGPIYTCAVIEKPPKQLETDCSEYLDMDPAGSMAVDQQLAKGPQVYYNMRPGLFSSSKDYHAKRSIRIKEPPMPSLSPTLLRNKKVISGRIVKKYRMSLKNVVHSIPPQHHELGLLNQRYDIVDRPSVLLRDLNSNVA